ncbi:hypothetical protein AGRHK599_LOCUS4890 [Rhizobium rhizogenes]|uniref:Polysaccharide biosynthesis enzyme WcbI domain-containing protein n=1 Tax=Rhizobium rhizogenes TaxID=359 RepID=A0AAN2AAM2_RHIRH|nr:MULTISPECIES: WcbI family polysaccharide biosynthesis putative acetyltransferase [Rhizobium/Agrobacterium group]AQS63441.1 hypothetical protein B0909_13655 [Rhizobium rhizogenes]MCZ7441289.1 WcbI family polysaccharide biosynthesis putative acetyltransferase [Rhizobium rhizogenes]NSZ82339.1 hypothetical protein [Agrobacterium tumefaciens]OAM62665.1 hypothetical protein A8L48_00200 [Rhizobium rhizogenes]CAD0216627.1 hypothetical protein AGRHK599_LOCUS4890 [Rhizobium rhizogenes]
MKIGVFGNCQTEGFATSVKNMTGAEVVEYTVQKARSASEEELQSQALKLSECDTVFTQPSITNNFGPLSFDKLSLICKSLVPFPHIATTSLHPDCHYIRDNGVALEGPMGPYHSAIIAGAFLAGLSSSRAVSLFNKYVYVTLKYTSVLVSRQPMSVDADDMGYDYTAFLSGDRGVFMHTPNHPNADVIFDTARQALGKAGISHTYANPPEDKLAELGVWPVYPEIATSLGMRGDMIFRQRKSRGGVFDLSEVVDAFFTSYAVSKITETPQIKAASAFIRSELV